MANIAASNDWPAGVYQYADGDVLDGGDDSFEVLPLKQLANRSLYQRLANVTPWDSALATEYGYPNKACVMHAGVSWRAVVANNVEPGTDAEKWERWAFSEAELNAKLAALLPYGVPTVCPNTGPVVDANKTRIHKSALGEYWMWLGDAWKVVADPNAMQAGVASSAVAGGGSFGVVSLPALPRNGRAYLRGLVSNLNGVAGANQMKAYINRVRAGVTTPVIESMSECTVTNINQYMQARPLAFISVQAGDTYQLVAESSGARLASPDSDSGIYLEYQ